MALSVVVTLAGLAAFADFTGDDDRAVAALNPGPLSSAHQVFTEGQGCAACHRAHEAGVGGWIRAVFMPGDQSSACLDCHEFAGPGMAPHNRVFAHDGDLPEPSCRVCHTEHRGGEFPINKVDDLMCGNCHEKRFTDFVSGHPEFPERFPYQTPNRINFDHSRHLLEYFVEQRYMAGRDAEFASVARGDCRVCHTVEAATREVRPRSFAESCQGCHAAQLVETPLVLFSPEEVLPIAAMMLGIDADDIYDEIGETAQMRLLQDLRRHGRDAFETGLETAGIDQGGMDIHIRGLSGALLRDAARTWLEDPYADPADAPDAGESRGGWYAGMDRQGLQSLHYLPVGHADPVMVAWLEFLARQADDPGADEVALMAAEMVLDVTGGAGACAKCHIAGIIGGVREEGRGRWSLAMSPERPHFNYAHAPHLRLLAPDAGCLECHKLDPSADYANWYQDKRWTFDAAAFNSNFVDIDKASCSGCHNSKAIRDDCQTCHTYHLVPTLRDAFKTRGGGEP